MGLTGKQELFIQEYCSNGYNAAQAYKKAYPNCKSGYNAHGAENIAKHSIKQAIDQYKAKIEKKLDLSRESQHAKLKVAYDVALTAKNPAAMTSAIREQNEMLGYHREKGLNPEKEAAKAKRMTDEQRETARVVAKIRTDEEAGVKAGVKVVRIRSAS